MALPQTQRVKAADLTASEFWRTGERENEQVKVHWVGYSHKNKWIGNVAEQKY